MSWGGLIWTFDASSGQLCGLVTAPSDTVLTRFALCASVLLVSSPASSRLSAFRLLPLSTAVRCRDSFLEGCLGFVGSYFLLVVSNKGLCGFLSMSSFPTSDVGTLWCFILTPVFFSTTPWWISHSMCMNLVLNEHPATLSMIAFQSWSLSSRLTAALPLVARPASTAGS